MNAYIKSLKEEGYTSLRDQHYDTFNNFPALGKKDTNNTPDPYTTDVEDQASKEDEDDETRTTGETVESNETTQVEEISLTEPVESAETLQEEEASLADPIEPGETTQIEEISLDLAESNETTQEEETSPTETSKDTSLAPPDKTPLPPTKLTLEDKSEPLDAADKHTTVKVKGCSVSMKSMLKPPSIRLPPTPTTPNQTLFPPPLPAPPVSSIPILQTQSGTGPAGIPHAQVYHREPTVR